MADGMDNLQEPVVVAERLSKTFRDFWGRPKAKALRDVSFTIAPGTVFGLLGPNGSGKSTTVKLLLGLLKPTRGTLKVMGKSPRDVQAKRRIGYLPEESYLYHYLTAEETLDFFASLFGLADKERRVRSEQLLEMVGLTHAAKRRVGEFSKGMARRLGLAQALINDPDLVILDEPTSGLDPLGCREVKDVIRVLSERGKTVVLCSHLLADVQDVCDELLVLYGGRSCASGAVSELLTVQDETLIRLRQAPESLVSEITESVLARAPSDSMSVEHPTMSLEQFFIGVIERVRLVGGDTSGAQSGGQVAGYLRGEDRLAALARSESERGETVAGRAVLDEAAAKQVSSERLRQLETSAEGKSTNETVSDDKDAATKKDADAANKRLRDLLGDKNQ